MRSSQAFWELRRQKGLHRRWVPQKGELGAEPGFVALQLNGLTLTARGMGSEVLPRRARGSEFAGRARGTEGSRLVSELARAVVSAEVSNYYFQKNHRYRI